MVDRRRFDWCRVAMLHQLSDAIDGRQRNGEGRADRVNLILRSERGKLCTRGELHRVERKGTDDSVLDLGRAAGESHADLGDFDARRRGVSRNANRVSGSGWIEGTV